MVIITVLLAIIAAVLLFGREIVLSVLAISAAIVVALGIGAAILVGVRRILETQVGQTILGFFVFCGLIAVLAGVFYVIGYR
jgi:hypothetical protein